MTEAIVRLHVERRGCQLQSDSDCDDPEVKPVNSRSSPRRLSTLDEADEAAVLHPGFP